MSTAAEREEQLKIQVLQQEAALRALQAELNTIRSADGSTHTATTTGKKRPHTAGSGRAAAVACGHTAAAPAPETADMHPHFPVECLDIQGSTPMAVEGHTAVPANGKVFIFGGTNNQQISNDVWAYAVATKKWKRCKSIVPPSSANQGNLPVNMGRYGHTSVMHNNAMVVFGGFGPGGIAGSSTTAASARCGLLNSTVAFDVNTNEWSVLNDGTGHVEAVKNHTAVAIRGRMYVFGGCLVDGRTNTMRCFDLERKQWMEPEAFNQQAIAAASSGATTLAKSDIPPPRSGHSANVYARNGQNAIVVFGGRLSKHTFSNDVFQYSTETKLWARMYCGGQLPPPRCDHSAALYKDHLVVFGGYALVQDETYDADGTVQAPQTRKEYYNDCYVLNLVSCTWSKVELAGYTQPLGMCGHTAILYQSPENQICMQVNGGWGCVKNDDTNLDEDAERTSRLVEGDITHSTLNDVWVFNIANAPSPTQDRSASQPRRRPQSGRGRPATAGRSPRQPLYSSTRPSTARSARNASPRLNADGTPVKRPWSIQTSKAATAKEFGEPTFKPHPPCVRLQYQVDSIVRRLADEDVKNKEENLQKLRSKFLKERQSQRMNVDEQQESLERLYYQQAEWQQEKKKQLDAKWCPRQERLEVDDDTLGEMVSRLTQVAPRRDPTPDQSTRRQSRHRTDECVKRLYTEQREFDVKRKEELERKYLWGGEDKTINSLQLNDMVERLTGSSPKRNR